jgi:hypothetical protein
LAIQKFVSKLYEKIGLPKEGPLTKNCPIDFAQSWAVYLKKYNWIYGEEKNGNSVTFLGPEDACKNADFAVAMLRYREKEADLRLSMVPT